MFKDALTREIAITLVIKLVLLYGLWLSFFSQPQDTTLTGAEVGHAFFGTMHDGRSLNIENDN